MIIRQDYIDHLLRFKDIKIIKILVGVRRCGKSTILDMYKDVLVEKYKVSSENIYKQTYTSKELPLNYNADDMFKDIKERIKNKGHLYLLLDEIQEVDGWEKVVNSLFESYDVDIYITGSNSKLLSSEISTYLSGRFVQIDIFTLSFKEYKKFKSHQNLTDDKIFENYLLYGGFPLIATIENNYNDAYQIVEGIYNTVISNDIARRHKITNKELFDRVVGFVMENTGKTFSATSIIKFLKSEHRTINIETIYNYLNWLMEAFIIYRCNRYDIQGKSVLKTQEKILFS